MKTAEDLLPFEHFHLYSFASEMVKGKRVLNIASREGHGARILAETARSVVAMDADEAVIQDASEIHQQENLQFVTGSVLNLPGRDCKDFDTIVFFDAIEDGIDPERVISEVKHLLAADGLLIMSVPAASRKNSITAKPFAPEEFYPLIECRFAAVERLVQRISGASIIERSGGPAGNLGDNDAGVDFLIAIASDGVLPKIERSIMTFPDISMLRSKERAIRGLLDMKAYLAETNKRQSKEISDHRRTIASLEEAFAWHTSQIEAITKTREFLDHEITELRRTIASDKQALEWRASQLDCQSGQIKEMTEALAWRASQVENLEGEKKQLEAALRQTSQQLTDTSRQLELIHASTGWKFILRARSIRSRLFPQGSFRDTGLQKLLNLLKGR